MTAKHLFFLLSALCPLALPACLAPQPVKHTYPRQSHHIQAAEYSQEIENLQKELARTKDKKLLADLHLKLARYYLSYNNPRHDYHKALMHYESFADLDKKRASQQEIQNWLAVLRRQRELSARIERGEDHGTEFAEKDEEIGRLNKEIKQLHTTLAAAREENNKITADNRELKTTIEKLKFLDLTLEEKRKNYR